MEDTTADNRPFYVDRVVTVRIAMTDEDWAFLQESALAEQYVRADLWYDGELIPDVAVRPKGNSSLRQAVQRGSPRIGLKVDLNFFNTARSLDGVNKLNFNNGFSDPTFIRERLAYEMYSDIGIATPRTSSVDLWVNDTHLGLYTMVEQVDKSFLGHHFTSNSGNLYKPEMPAATLDWTLQDLNQQRESMGTTLTADEMDIADINLGGGKLIDILGALAPKATTTDVNSVSSPPDMSPGPAPGGNQPGQTRDLITTMGLKTNENKPDHSLLFRFLDILNNEPDETFADEIETVLDVDEVLRFLAVSAIIVHLDNYIGLCHNYYLYDNDGIFVIIPWDLNMAFGTFNYGLNRNQLLNYYIDEPTGGPSAQRPLVSRLLKHPPYLDVYHGYLQELLASSFSGEHMNSRIDELADQIRPYVKADELKFFTTAQFETSLSADILRGKVEGGALPIGLKAFIKERSQSVRLQLAGLRRSSSGDGSGNGGSFRRPTQPQQPPRQIPGNLPPNIRDS